MSLSAITPISSSDSLGAVLSLGSSVSSSTSESSASVSLSPAQNTVVSTSTAAAIRSTVSLPSSASVTPPLSTDTLQLLQDLSTGNFSAAKSDVAKVQQDLQSQHAAPTPSSQAAAPSSSSSSTSDASINKLLTSLKESLEAGDTGKALGIITGFLAQTTNFSGAIVNTTA